MIAGQRKKILVPLVLGLVLISAGFFYFDWKKEKEVGLILTNNFIEKEKEDVKTIENESIGLKVQILKDWEVIDNIDSFLFISPDFEMHPRGMYEVPIPHKGCVIKMAVKKEIADSSYDIEYSALKEQINYCTISEKECGYQLVWISGYKAIKDVYSVKGELFSGDRVSIKAAENEKIYKFETYLFSPEADYCAQAFNDFLDKAVIK